MTEDTPTSPQSKTSAALFVDSCELKEMTGHSTLDVEHVMRPDETWTGLARVQIYDGGQIVALFNAEDDQTAITVICKEPCDGIKCTAADLTEEIRKGGFGGNGGAA
ncbi:hypothetical protein [Roseovarius indicus]|uniref:hypothetical protein n=1 Tax=Roseovarius indicus TaxID=540747 RepID=UPI0010FCEF8C|nr:hypothetical protein [Roseovarius indicus]